MIIPEDVRKLVVDKIDSVAQMEALLLLRNEANHDWEAAEVAERLYTTPVEAARLLETLAARGFFAQRESCYRYQPESEQLRDTVDVLADTWRTRLIPVTGLIHAKSTSSLQKFADAFRFRKEA